MTLIKEIMTANPVCVNTQDSLKQALNTMRTQSVSHLLVESMDKKLAGIISKGDILKYLLDVLARTSGKTYTANELNNILVENVMSDELLSLKEEDEVSSAVQLLVHNRINCLPVVNESDEIIGIVTGHDVMNSFV